MSEKSVSRLLLFLFLFFSACGGETEKALKVGDKGPDFTAVSLAGETIRLSAWKGSPVIIRFWSTDCKYCRADTPIFNSYFDKYKDQGLHVVYINTGGEPVDVVKAFVADLDIGFPVIAEGGAAVGDKYNVKIVPQTIFLAPDSTILTAILGGVGEAEFNEILGQYLQDRN